MNRVGSFALALLMILTIVPLNALAMPEEYLAHDNILDYDWDENASDDVGGPVGPNIGHLEARLVALEEAQQALLSDFQEDMLEELEQIADEIRAVNDSINDAWEAYLANDPYEHCDEDPCDCYDEDDEEPETGEEEPYYLNEDYFYVPAIDPNPDFVLPVPMSDAEITAIVNAEISQLSTRHYINTPAQLRDFLGGGIGTNYDHYILTANINVIDGSAAFTTPGRPGVFTGRFESSEGNNFTITNLRLRPTNEAHRGVGFVQEAGDGAVIRNVTFNNAGTGDTDRSYDDAQTGGNWRGNVSGIGMVVGRTTAPVGGSAVVTIENVNLIGTHQMTIRVPTGPQPADNTGGRVQQGGRSTHVAALGTGTHANSRIGGMVGQVDANTTLIMRDVSASTINLNTAGTAGGGWGFIIAAGGGLVGAVDGGTLDIRTSEFDGTNQVTAVSFGHQGRGTGGNDHVQTTRGVSFGGGVVGRVFSGNVFIENTSVGSGTSGSPTPATYLHSEVGHIDAINVGGGIIGAAGVGTNIRLDNVHNLSIPVGARAHGSMHGDIPRGRAGGLVGHTAGTLTIVDSSNNARVRGSNGSDSGTAEQRTATFLGGLLGYGAPSSAVIINRSENGANAHFVHHRTLLAVTNHNAGSASIGGIIGVARGFTAITDTDNRGVVTKQRTEEAGHGENTHIGGIIGRAQPVAGGGLQLINVRNFGNVTIGGSGTGGTAAHPGRGSVGGIVGEILPTVGGNAPIVIRDAENHSEIRGGRQNGGIVGWSRANNVRIDDAINRGALVTTHTNSGTANNRGNAVPDTGGIVGRISGASTTINNPVNHGHITPASAQAGGLGGIVGRSHGTRTTIVGAVNNGNISSTTAIIRNAGGIVGIITSSNAMISDSVNNGSITLTGNVANAAGGIVGRIGATAGANNHTTGTGNSLRARNAANASINNVQNYGQVRASARAGGIVGFSAANNTLIERAMNYATVESTNTGNQATAGGIVGFNNRTRMTVRNSGNVGTITSATGTGAAGQRNRSAGTGGIIGRSQRANTRIESSYNQGAISGSVATGGIVGRNEASLIIQDVYNIGPVHGVLPGSGNGIVGRRRTGTITISRAWVSADVRGYAIGVSRSARNMPSTSGRTQADVRGFRFSQVYVDGTTTIQNTDFAFGSRPATQHDRPGITLVDTELLTLGLLPGIRDGQGPWVYGMIDAYGEVTNIEDFRTYAYFNWQVPGSRQELFFDSITAISTDPDLLPNTPMNVMDLVHWTNPVTFRNVGEAPESIYNSIAHARGLTGVRQFNTYRGSAAGAFTPAALGEVSTLVVPGRDGAFSATNPTSIGLISSNGVVGWSPRDVHGRLIFTAYDCASGEDITHVQFHLESEGNGQSPIFFNQSVDFTVEPPVVIETHNFDGFAIIMFHISDGNIYHLNPRNTGLIPGVAAQSLAEALLQYTTVGATANPGYDPAWHTITTGDFDAYTGSGHIRIPMVRQPFELYVWVRDYWEEDPPNPEADVSTANPDPNPNNHPFNEDSEVWEADYIPGQALAVAELTHVRPEATCDYPWSVEFPAVLRSTIPAIDGDGVADSWTLRGGTNAQLNAITETAPRQHFPGGRTDGSIGGRYFRVSDAMFGDTFTGTGTGPANTIEAHGNFTNHGRYLIPTSRVRSVESIENLRFEHLREFPEGSGRWHLDIYVEAIELLPPVHFQFVDALYPQTLLNIANIGFEITSWGSNVTPDTIAVPTTHYRTEHLTLDSTFDVRWLLSDPDFIDQIGIHTVEDFVFHYEAEGETEPLHRFFTVTQDVDAYGDFVETVHTNPLVIRVPLIRRNEHIVYVVERLPDGTYVPVEGATVRRAEVPLDLIPGTEGPLFDNNRFLVPYLHAMNVFEVIADGGFGTSFHVKNMEEFQRDVQDEPIPVRIVLTRVTPRVVNFMYNTTPADTNIFETIHVDYNMPIPEPTEDPVRTDYRFDGWLADRNDSESLWDFSTRIDEHMNLYALWTRLHRINFMYNYPDNTAIFHYQDVANNEFIDTDILDAAGTPIRTGYVFAGWFTAATDGVEFDMTTAITAPLNLHAHWTPAPQITFHAYTENEGLLAMFEEDGEIEVFVRPGEPRNEWPGYAELQVALAVGHIYGASGSPGHAFWGWFDDETLDASGRDRIVDGTTFRRPALGDRCLLEALLVRIEEGDEAAMEELFGADNNVDIFAIWSRWGDANDDDEVDGDDITAMEQFIADEVIRRLNEEIPGLDLPLPYNVAINERAADVNVSGNVDGDDITMVEQFIADEVIRRLNEAIPGLNLPLPYNVVLGRRPA